MHIGSSRMTAGRRTLPAKTRQSGRPQPRDGRVAGQRVPIRVPRMPKREIPLRSYEALHGDLDLLLTCVWDLPQTGGRRRTIPGRSACRGRRCPDSGTRRNSASSSSCRGGLRGPRAGRQDVQATMVVALGITMTGDKRFPLSRQDTEDTNQVLTPYRSRGSSYLAIIPRLKHPSLAMSWKHDISRAVCWASASVRHEALAALQAPACWRIGPIRRPALAEGLDETLTLHRIGCIAGPVAETTNGLESINALIDVCEGRSLAGLKSTPSLARQRQDHRPGAQRSPSGCAVPREGC